jgi:dTMP kinase
MLGLYLREYLKSKRPLSLESELLLFAAARAQLVSEQIEPALIKGISVIADRYTGSTVAYQGYGRGIKREVVDYLNDYVTGGLDPDATFFLDIGPEEGLQRVGSPQLRMALSPEDSFDVGRADIQGHRRFEDQTVAFHNRVRRGYLELAKSFSSWHTLDAGLTQDELGQGIWNIVASLLESAKRRQTTDNSVSLF